MSIYFFRFLSLLIFGGALLAACGGVNNSVKTFSEQSKADGKNSNTVLSPTSSKAVKGEQTAVFAGGCFWGVEGVFEHVKGVSDVVSGFSYGSVKTADSKTMSAEKAGYAEAVKVAYDSSEISYEQLLKIFLLAAHNPTELNRQGPDVGEQYRSVIFYSNDEQKQLAENYIAGLNEAKTYAQPIVTEVVALDLFKQAEDNHQDYMVRHPNDDYIVVNDNPKLENFRQQFPDLYVSK